MFKNYVGKVHQRNKWEKYLLLVDYAYNNIVYISTRKFPFVVGCPKLPSILRMSRIEGGFSKYSRRYTCISTKAESCCQIALTRRELQEGDHVLLVHY